MPPDQRESSFANPRLPDDASHDRPRTTTTIVTSRWFQGMLLASIFSLSYIVAPMYMFSAIALVILQYPTRLLAWVYAVPFVLSIVTPAMAFPGLVGKMTTMLDYFQFEKIIEIVDNVDPIEEIRKGKNYILAAQPHGVISFCGICSAIYTDYDLRFIKTAVASAVLRTPILKHVVGIFGLTDASAKNLTKILKCKGVEGTVVIYVGGMAELFLSSRKEERLYLSKRKGFIKMALREGVDVIPIYLFGNTSVLTVVKNGPLAYLSRNLQVSLTYFWGKYHLPIPRDDKLLYVAAPPLGIPHILNPTQEDIDKWHAKYCSEVRRLFDKYKEKVPMYKHKQLYIE